MNPEVYNAICAEYEKLVQGLWTEVIELRRENGKQRTRRIAAEAELLEVQEKHIDSVAFCNERLKNYFETLGVLALFISETNWRDVIPGEVTKWIDSPDEITHRHNEDGRGDFTEATGES